MGNGEMKLNRYPNRLEMKRIRAYASTLSATPHLRVRTVQTEILTRRSGEWRNPLRGVKDEEL